MTDHPAVIQSQERLARYNRRTPPGYPLGYNLHTHKYLCTGCGYEVSFATLTTIDRAGAHNKSYHSSTPKEKIYDLPIDSVTSTYLTPRCERCIDTLPREAVPSLPGYKDILGPSKERGDTLDLNDFKDLAP